MANEHIRITQQNFIEIVKYIVAVETERAAAKTDGSSYKIPAIKMLRSLFPLALKTAKDIVESVGEPPVDPTVACIQANEILFI